MFPHANERRADRVFSSRHSRERVSERAVASALIKIAIRIAKVAMTDHPFEGYKATPIWAIFKLAVWNSPRHSNEPEGAEMCAFIHDASNIQQSLV